MPKPLIGVLCEVNQDGLHPYHRVSEKYARAVINGMGAVPVLIPAMVDAGGGVDIDIEALLGHVHGVLLPGGYSNVEPHHYAARSREGTIHDSARDAVALAIIPAAIKRGMPLLGICRGFQEMNVAYGGSLHQHVQELPEFNDHRENKADPIEVQYGHSHEVQIMASGILQQISGQTTAWVNSLHGQGIHRLGEGLQVEAVASDGLIEAITYPQGSAFNLGVQWHPEYNVHEDAFYQSIFSAFASACNKRQQEHTC
ncbi:MAG: gamma-glutamyl-gamma-aminobutyrate hydrolase family protein [Gammaproteobacteria bacterium]|nr:gamma-glutamyl-gamma-aminobutyrate hydrolase family protein [Gammaproteobacteria bacterium]